uniref:Uncharacterized protein n=1 Tax=Steinernema glaseri TaxID=37863 RepID=A0A1I7ZLI0_9BILA
MTAVPEAFPWCSKSKEKVDLIDQIPSILTWNNLKVDMRLDETPVFSCEAFYDDMNTVKFQGARDTSLTFSSHFNSCDILLFSSALIRKSSQKFLQSAELRRDSDG